MRHHIISDIAGEFDAMVRLVNKIVKGNDKVYLVGDLNDRGEKSKQVIQWVMDNDAWVTTVNSNHAHMFVDWYENGGIYESEDFFRNGGLATLRSYGCGSTDKKVAKESIPWSHIQFLKNCPAFHWIDNRVLITHAPVNWDIGFENSTNIKNNTYLMHNVLWNRAPFQAQEGAVQVFGHNSHWGLKRFMQPCGKLLAGVCLDDSRHKVLTSWTFPDDLITQEPYEVSYGSQKSL